MPSLSVPFKSTHPRPADPTIGETEEDVRQNNEFDLKYCLPDSCPETQISDVVVMVNGFAEWTDDLYADPQFGLSALLAKQGCASVVLPIPFHLYRIPSTEKYQRMSRRFALFSKIRQERHWFGVPAALVSSNLIRFYLGYRQLISDIVNLGEQIREGRTEEYRKWFAPDARIHLLGYSLGGLGCLAAFVKRRKLVELGLRKGVLFDTCTLLCSGSGFEDLSPGPLGFKTDDWNVLRDYYYKQRFVDEFVNTRKEIQYFAALDANDQITAEALAKEINVDAATRRRPRLGEILNQLSEIDLKTDHHSYTLFERIVLGLESRFDTEILDVSHRIVFYVGTLDPVVRPETLLGVPLAERKFWVVQIPGLEHIFVRTPAWQMWGEFVVSDMVRFMRTHPNGRQAVKARARELMDDVDEHVREAIRQYLRLRGLVLEDGGAAADWPYLREPSLDATPSQMQELADRLQPLLRRLAEL